MEEEEEKKEPPTPLQEITPQEYFFMNSTRSYKTGIVAVEIKRWEKLTNRLFTSFALSSQALGVGTDAFNEIAITQGLTNKQALVVKNSLLAMVDKSAGLGKKANEEEASRVSAMFNLFLNFLEYIRSISIFIKNELNSDIASLYADKKSDAVQTYITRTEGCLRQTTIGFVEILTQLIQSKIDTLSAMGEDTSELTKELEKALDTHCLYEKLSGLRLLEKVMAIEEYTSYLSMKKRDEE